MSSSHALGALVELSVVTTTVAHEADATRLAQLAVQQHLAACAQVEAITSHYVWEGALHADREWRVLAKTIAARVLALLELWQQAHPYALPQLVVQPLQASPAYAAWVHEAVAASAPVLRC